MVMHEFSNRQEAGAAALKACNIRFLKEYLTAQHQFRVVGHFEHQYPTGEIENWAAFDWSDGKSLDLEAALMSHVQDALVDKKFRLWRIDRKLTQVMSH